MSKKIDVYRDELKRRATERFVYPILITILGLYLAFNISTPLGVIVVICAIISYVYIDDRCNDILELIDELEDD